MTGASAGNVNRAFARASSSTSRSVARAGIWRMRGCCTGPVENPSFHVRSPSSNASNNVGATGVVTAVDSSVRVRVIIVTLLLESGVSRKRNKLTRVLQRLHSFFRRGYLTREPVVAGVGCHIVATGPFQPYQRIGIPDGELLQEQAVDGAEECRVGANPERERRDDDRRPALVA